MSKYMGIYTAPAIMSSQPNPAGIFAMDEATVQSGNAFLVSELEKRDTNIRKPLTSVTYPRDIVITTGGGWAEYLSAMSVGYAVTGGAQAGPVTAGGANALPIVQANLDKGVYKTHTFAVALRVMWQDMQRAQYIGRSLDALLQDGVRMAYDKHNDANVYMGLPEYNTTGLINNPDAVETTVAAGASGKTNWVDKTPQEILADINTALTATWDAAANDKPAMPNHILLPYAEYSYLINTMVTELAGKSIMQYIRENNIAAEEGVDLFIAPTSWCKEAGTSGTDRMVVYVNHERFVKYEELVPLMRCMTGPVPTFFCYDTTYAANLSEVEIFYPQTITYWDGIGGAT